MDLSDEQRSFCWKQRSHNVGWDKIAKHFGVTGQTLRYALNPEAAQLRQDRRIARAKALRAAKQRTAIRERVHFEARHHFQISNDILQERDRRLAIPYPNFTAEFFGDPKPGFSALDKKKAQGLWRT